MAEENKTINAVLGKDGKPVIYATLANTSTNSEEDTPSVAYGSGSGLRCIRLNIIDAETMTSVEEVDVYTVADAVYYNTATGETILDYIDFRLAYTNANPMPADVGNFPKGTTFVSMDLKDVLEGILYPTINPTVVLSCNVDMDKSYEMGVNISPVTFTITISNTTETASLANLYKDDANIASFANLPNGEGTATYSYGGTVNTTNVYKAILTFPSGVVESNEIVIPFVYPIYRTLTTNEISDDSITALLDDASDIDIVPLDLYDKGIKYLYETDKGKAYNIIFIPEAYNGTRGESRINIFVNNILSNSAFTVYNGIEKAVNGETVNYTAYVSNNQVNIKEGTYLEIRRDKLFDTIVTG